MKKVNDLELVVTFYEKFFQYIAEAIELFE